MRRTRYLLGMMRVLGPMPFARMAARRLRRHRHAVPAGAYRRLLARTPAPVTPTDAPEPVVIAAADLGDVTARQRLLAAPWAMVLDAGCTLADDAAAWLATACDGADVVYGSHDKRDADGQRHGPWLPPAYGAATAWGNLLLGSAAATGDVWQRVYDDIGPAAASDPWHRHLALARHGRRIERVAGVLVHHDTPDAWRTEPRPADCEAIRQHLHATGHDDGRVAVHDDGTMDVTWQHERPRVSIIIPTLDAPHLLEPCLDRLLAATDYPDLQVIVIDTGSSDPDALALQEAAAADDRVLVMADAEPFNWSRVNNRAAAVATGEVLVFLNNDTEALRPDWLDRLTSWLSRDDVGIAGGLLTYPDGTLQHAGLTLGLGSIAAPAGAGLPPDAPSLVGRLDTYRDVTAVTGACLAMRRDRFQELGGFDEAFAMSHSDLALCLAARAAGWRVVVDPNVRLIHKERATRGPGTPSSDDRRALRLFEESLTAGDPFWHPWLSTRFTTPRLRTAGEETPAERAHWLFGGSAGTEPGSK